MAYSTSSSASPANNSVEEVFISPAVRFDAEAVLIPEVGPPRPHLATRKYSLPLSIHRKPPPELVNDPTFIPDPPGPCLKLTLPSLSRAPPRPHLHKVRHTFHDIAHAERRRSTGHYELGAGKPAKGSRREENHEEDGEDPAETYFLEYGLRSCLAHRRRRSEDHGVVDKDGKQGKTQEGEIGAGPPIVVVSPLERAASTLPAHHPPFSPSSPPTPSKGVRALTRRLSASLNTSGRRNIHPGRIVEEPELEPRAAGSLAGTYRNMSRNSEEALSTSLPHSGSHMPLMTDSRSRSTSSFSTPTMSIISEARVPLHGCCAACNRAAELGAMRDWVIGFDEKAQEKRDRDREEKENTVDVFAMGSDKNGEEDGDVKVRKMDVVVDEVDCVHRKDGKTSAMNDGMPLEKHHSPHADKVEDDFAWPKFQPGTSPTQSFTTTASSSYEVRSPLQLMCGSAKTTSPGIMDGIDEGSGYFDSIPPASTDSNGDHILEPVPEARAAEVGHTSAIWQAIEGVRAAEKVKSSTSPPPSKAKRPNSASGASDKGRSGGWFGLSVTKALGVM